MRDFVCIRDILLDDIDHLSWGMCVCIRVEILQSTLRTMMCIQRHVITLMGGYFDEN